MAGWAAASGLEMEGLEMEGKEGSGLMQASESAQNLAVELGELVIQVGMGGMQEDKEVQDEMEDCLLEVLEEVSPGIADQKFAKGKVVE